MKALYNSPAHSLPATCQPVFRTITGEDWRRSIAEARAQSNLCIEKIRAAEVRLLSQRSSGEERLVHTQEVPSSSLGAASTSQHGTGRACVPFELARAGTKKPAQGSSKSVSTTPDGNLPSEDVESGRKTASTKAELRAENTLAAAGGLAGEEGAGDRRNQGECPRSAGGGETL